MRTRDSILVAEREASDLAGCSECIRCGQPVHGLPNEAKGAW